jgi:hypothetical protein
MPVVMSLITAPRRPRPVVPRVLGVAVVAVALLGVPISALAQEEPALEITGRVVGDLTRGSQVTFRITATSPGGFRSLSKVSVQLNLHDIPLEEMRLDLDDNAISVGDGRVLVGTANTIEGSFFQVSGLDVTTTTSGNAVRIDFHASMLQTVPEGATFVLTATDDAGERASVTRVANLPPPPEEGFPWGTVAAAVFAALFAGAFIGNLFASHRRPAVRPSIYSTVQRRLDEERARK